MTKYEVSTLCMKLLGIYCFIQAVPLLQQLVIFIGMANSEVKTSFSPVLVIGTLLPLCILVGVGCSLLCGSKALAKRLVGAPAVEDTQDGFVAAYVQAVAFAAVGVFVFSLAVPKLIQIAVNIHALRHNEALTQEQRSLLYSLPQIIGVVAQIALGVGLFLGATGLARLWRRACGRAETEDQPTTGST